MGLLGSIGLVAILVGAFWWGVLPQLRKLPWWDAFSAGVAARLRSLGARLWIIAGNSKTIAVAYAAELIGLLDELKLLDWSALIGSERAGRVMVAMGAVMIVLRLVTRAAVSFKPQP
jgi:hypothetical protein